MGFEPTTPCLQTVRTTGPGGLSWAPTRTERPGTTSIVRVVWHVRGTASTAIQAWSMANRRTDVNGFTQMDNTRKPP